MTIETGGEGWREAAGPRHVIERSLGTATIIAVAVVGVALGTWNASDPSLSVATGNAATNLLGAPGAVVADILMQFGGLAALAFLAVPLMWGFALRAGRAEGALRDWPMRLLCWLVGTLLAAAALGALPSTDAWPLPTGLGGVVGDLALKPLGSLFGGLPTGFASILVALPLALLSRSVLLRAASLAPREADEDAGSVGRLHAAVAVLVGTVTHWWLVGRGLVGRVAKSTAEGKAKRAALRREREDAAAREAAMDAERAAAERAAMPAEPAYEPTVVPEPVFEGQGTIADQAPMLDAGIEALSPFAAAATIPPVEAWNAVPLATMDRVGAPMSVDPSEWDEEKMRLHGLLPRRAQPERADPVVEVPAEHVAGPEVTAAPLPQPAPVTVAFDAPNYADAPRVAVAHYDPMPAPAPAPSVPIDMQPAYGSMAPAVTLGTTPVPMVTPQVAMPPMVVAQPAAPRPVIRVPAPSQRVAMPTEAPQPVAAPQPQAPAAPAPLPSMPWTQPQGVPHPVPMATAKPAPVPTAPVAEAAAPSTTIHAPGSIQTAAPRGATFAAAPEATPAPITMPPAAHTLPAAPAGAPETFTLPSIDFLRPKVDMGENDEHDEDLLRDKAAALEAVLADFGVKGSIIDVQPGPVVTLYLLEPAPGIKSSRVIGLAEDIARSMSAIAARVAVVPGRNAIGIELPNVSREMVMLREIVEEPAFADSSQKLALTLGKDIGGTPVVADLAKMPHLLVAGTTGSGKSVAINTMILSLLYRMTPAECRLIMIDPKMLELSVYDGIPHLLSPVVTDPKKAVVALKWCVREMEERYKKMAKLGVRNIGGFNERVVEAKRTGESLSRTVQTGFDRTTGEAIYETEEIESEAMPFIVVIIDEMADLMMVAGKDIEGAVQRLAQMARAAGIHVVMATQRPSTDVITGTIKANFPTRISFQVTSKVDSRVMLGESGAEQLLGMGDMLYMTGGGRTQRVHGPFVSDEEVEGIVRHLKTQGVPDYLEDVTVDEEEEVEADTPVADNGAATAMEDSDDPYDQAVALVMRDGKASTSYVQRRLGIGYNRAASLIERMEKEGVISKPNSAGKREILLEAGAVDAAE